MVECNWSRTHHAPEYRAADSKRRPGQEQPDHRKGELKAPEHDRDHWFLGAALVGNQQMIARFVGWWTRKDSDSSPTFNSASCWDRITSEQFVEKQWEPVKRWLRILAPNGAPAVRKTKQEKLEEQGLWDGRS